MSGGNQVVVDKVVKLEEIVSEHHRNITGQIKNLEKKVEKLETKCNK
jgi:hypothetical protein